MADFLYCAHVFARDKVLFKKGTISVILLLEFSSYGTSNPFGTRGHHFIYWPSIGLELYAMSGSQDVNPFKHFRELFWSRACRAFFTTNHKMQFLLGGKKHSLTTSPLLCYLVCHSCQGFFFFCCQMSSNYSLEVKLFFTQLRKRPDIILPFRNVFVQMSF